MRANGVVLGLALVLVFGAIEACAPRTGGSGDRSRVSRTELIQTNASNLYDALELLRPSWMTGRGPISATDPTEARANVYMQGSRMGGLDYLRQVSVSDVESLRYFRAGEAAARFGMGNPRGVIEILPRR